MHDDDSPFHSGELIVQERSGMRQRIERAGRRMIRDFMPDEHRLFFEELPFLVVGSLDDRGRPWASIVHGSPGFVTSPHPRSLMVAALPTAGDPLHDNLRAGAPLGLLGIQLETRRRNRANGRVVWKSESGFELAVEQSFGNCKQYIQSRTRQGPAGAPSAQPGGSALGRRALELLSRCDTAFVASASASPALGGREGVDVSHRGGLPGFLHVEGSRVTLPDYRGNFLFNTLGNIEVNPRAGLVACDLERGDLLLLTASASVSWEGSAFRQFPGAERLLHLDVAEHVLLSAGLGEVWSAPEFATEFARIE
jgi:uncharacterized protein